MKSFFVFALAFGLTLAGQPEKELAKALVQQYEATGLNGRPVDNV